MEIGASCGTVCNCCGLWNANAQYAPGCAGGSRANAHHHPGSTGSHQLQRHLIGDAITDHHGQAHALAQLFEVQGGLTFRTDVVGRHHRGLHKEEIRACFSDGLAETHRCHWGATHSGDAPLGLDVLNPFADQLLLDGLAVDLLHQRNKFRFADGGNAIQNRIGILVTGLNTLKVQNAKGTQL